MYYYIFGGVGVALLFWTVGSYLAIRNLEEPSYVVVEKNSNYEIRKYAPYIIAETDITGSYDEASNSGFRLIADYIFGNNTTQSSIAMTVPVIQNKSEKIAMTAPVLSMEKDSQVRTVSFVLPSAYTLETLPTPNNPLVRLTEVPGRTVVAIRFTGYATEARVAKKQAALEKTLGEARLTAAGPAQVAQYNPPFSMPLMRRNEILIPVNAAE
jgi:hypothetical protein